MAVACGGVLSALALAACGGDGDDREQVTGAFDEVRAGVDAGDARRVCDRLGPRGLNQVMDAVHGEYNSCVEAVRPLLEALRKSRPPTGSSSDPTVKDVELKLTAVATIAVEGRSVEIPFVKKDGEWKLNSFYGLSPRSSVAIQ